MVNYIINIDKKGISLIEAILAIVILVFPVFATLSTVTFLKNQIHKRNLELLAENLTNYILEDLRGRRFYYFPGDDVNEKNNLQRLYEILPQSFILPNGSDPFGYPGERIMKYSCVNDLISDTEIYDKNNPSYTYPYVEFPSDDSRKFYNTFKVELYLTRFINADVNEPIESIDPYKFIYKIDVVLLIEDPKSSYTNILGTVQGLRRFTVASTQVTYHEP